MIALVYTLTTADDSGIMLVKTFTDSKSLTKFEKHAINELTPVTHLMGSHVLSEPTVTNAKSLQRFDPHFKKFKLVDSISEILSYQSAAQHQLDQTLEKIKINAADQKVRHS